MDRNFLLALALSFLVLFGWSVFVGSPRDDPREGSTAGEPGATAPERPGREARSDESRDPQEGRTSSGVREGGPRETDRPRARREARPEGGAPRAESEERVVVRNPLFEAELTTRGGGLLRWELRRYEDHSTKEARPVQLATVDPDSEVALATPFESLGHGDLSQAAYELDRRGSRELVFTREEQGVRVRKTYSFEDEGYGLRLHLAVQNGSDRYLRTGFRTRWPARVREGRDFQEFSLAARVKGSLEEAVVGEAPAFMGLFGGGTLEEPRSFEGGVDWAGAHMRYFLAALIPDLPREATARFEPVRVGEKAIAELGFEPVEIPPGQRAEREIRVYIGPKEGDRLDAAGAHLEDALRRGWFPSLTRFFTWLLNATYEIVPNYGVAIILVTLLVRLLLAPVMARQMRSMRKMSELQPKMKEIQEKYKDDRQKQSEAIMAMYRQEGMSPFSALSGCLPMLLQLPVFIGLFYALRGAIELRHAPFVLWIDDLSAPEALFTLPELEIPVRLLPLLMGGSMVLQQRLTPTAMDPAQARMMMTVMPVMFTLIFYQFASGLVLYWLVSNLLGLGQQLLQNRGAGAPAAPAKASDGAAQGAAAEPSSAGTEAGGGKAAASGSKGRRKGSRGKRR